MKWFSQLLIDIQAQESSGVPNKEIRAGVRKVFKANDDSNLWPCLSGIPVDNEGDTRVVDPVGAAIAAVSRYERESGDSLDGEAYALSCREELARIVNLSRNLPCQSLNSLHIALSRATVR